MYSTLTKAPEHAVVVISELLAAHGQSVHERGDSLVFNIDEGPKSQRSRNRFLKRASEMWVPVPKFPISRLALSGVEHFSPVESDHPTPTRESGPSTPGGCSIAALA